jgi:EVE domain
MRRYACETIPHVSADELLARPPQRFWIAVASAEHARNGRTLGIMQVCHGKDGPLRRLRAGDGVVYYSQTETFRGKDRLQTFRSIGFAQDDRVYQADMGGGVHPFRRDIAYLPAKEAPIAPLLEQLEFTRGKRNWGYVFRFGLAEISKADFDLIAAAMDAKM